MKKKKVQIGRVVLPYAMVAPIMILLLVFTFYPIVNMIYLSFFENKLNGNVFVGWANYQRLFMGEGFVNAFKNTLIYMVFVTLFVIFLGLVLALSLQRDTKINAIAQRVMFLPHICAMLAISLIWQWLMDDEGLLNALFSFFNLPALRWLNSSATSLLSIMLVVIWKGLGYHALLLLSSVKSIPTELLEAAELDDAGKWRTFWKITFPMLTPQLFFLLITLTMNSFKVFDVVRLMTGGGPGSSSDVLVYYIYRYAREYNKYGIGSAAGVILMIILFGFTLVYFRVVEKKVHYQ